MLSQHLLSLVVNHLEDARVYELARHINQMTTQPVAVGLDELQRALQLDYVVLAASGIEAVPVSSLVLVREFAVHCLNQTHRDRFCALKRRV